MKKRYLLIPLLLLASCQKVSIPITTTPHITTTNTPSINTSINNETTDSIPENIIPPTLNENKKVKVYLNPSVQKNNLYYNKITTEAEMMNKVSNEIYIELSKDPRFIVYHNDRYLSLSESVKESNSLNVDYHIALHTNAGGGSGSEAYYSGNSYFANHILNSFNKYHNFKNRGIKNGNHLYEIKNSTAKNKTLIEFLFHDNKQECDFIIKNYVVLALSICEALYELVKE